MEEKCKYLKKEEWQRSVKIWGQKYELCFQMDIFRKKKS